MHTQVVGGGGEGVFLTSEGGLEVDLGLLVQVLHARRPAVGQEDVLLLVPWGRVVHRPLALIVQAGHGCEEKHTHTHSWRLGQRSSNMSDKGLKSAIYHHGDDSLLLAKRFTYAHMVG